jgi:signal transduction histidine kinase
MLKQGVQNMVQAMGKGIAKLMDPLYDRMVLVLTFLFCAGLALMLLHVSRLQDNVIESMAMANSEVYAPALAEIQNLYSSEIVERVRVQDMKSTWTLMALLAVLWLGGMGLVISKLRHTSEESERLVIQRTADFKHANKELQKQVATRERVEAELRVAHEELEKRVQERTSKLVQANEELKTEVSERKRAEDAIYQLNQELVEQRDQLELSNKELEAFSYSVAHDLRAPLRGIDGFSQAVLEDYGEILKEKGKNYLHRVREASQRMAKLIDAMLDLARLTRAEIHPESTDFSGMVESIISDLQKLEPNRQVEWVMAKGIQVEADPDLLRVVLQNLLGNAWKFTSHESEPRIEVGITYHYSQPVYFVRDNGVGFDMTYVNKLFWAFHRLHAINEFPGIGIGLATVKRIIGRHGGRIWADATEGKGATFYFTLDS